MPVPHSLPFFIYLVHPIIQHICMFFKAKMLTFRTWAGSGNAAFPRFPYTFRHLSLHTYNLHPDGRIRGEHVPHNEVKFILHTLVVGIAVYLRKGADILVRH